MAEKEKYSIDSNIFLSDCEKFLLKLRVDFQKETLKEFFKRTLKNV